MNTKCPQCDAPYNVTEAHVGRRFKCKGCGTALAVTEAGVTYQDAPAASPPPAADNAFDLGDDNGGGGGRPARMSRRGGAAPAQGGVADYLTFRKMIVPLIIQIIFWFLTGVVILVGLGVAIAGIVTGIPSAILVGIAFLLIGVPVNILLVRMYCELVIVVFRINDTLTDIKNALEHQPR